MKTVRRFINHVFCFWLALTGVAFAEGDSTFRYSDEWALVSAPPPSGPYRLVHIDPRVPGQGIAPPLVTGVDHSSADSEDVAADSVTTEQQQPEQPAGVGVSDGAAAAIPAVPDTPALPAPAAIQAATPELEVPPPPAAGVPSANVPEPVPPVTDIGRDRQTAEPDVLTATPQAMPPPVPGYYGRMMPPPPRYEYPGSAWQGAPGYRTMPPTGYYPAPAMPAAGEYPSPVYRPGNPYHAR